MHPNNRQVFQASSPKRAKIFTLIIRSIIILLLGAVIIIIFSVSKNSQTNFPKVFDQYGYMKQIVNLEGKHMPGHAYQEARKAIRKKPLMGYLNQSQLIKKRKYQKQIRAAFYVNWDNQSFYSLKEHLHQLDIVFPEWFTIDPKADTVISKIDPKAVILLKHFKIKVIPILSNYSNGKFDGKIIHQIIINPNRRKRLIQSIEQNLKKNHFEGVNIDFEDLTETTDEYVIQFQKELYAELHKNGLLVTQDIIPRNIDYNLKELKKYNDYLLLMAYDEHSTNSKPGAIASQNWIEKVLDSYGRDLPEEKTILCLGAYGYDWKEGEPAKPTTYQTAIDKANSMNSTIEFDSIGYNLSFSYPDEDGSSHQLYFTDAVSNFNAMRLAVEYGLAGTALWRLGSEDPRLWQFYNRELSSKELAQKKIDLTNMGLIKPTDQISFIGDGDILDVIEQPHPGNATLVFDSVYSIIDHEIYNKLPSSYLIRKIGIADKKLVLSFDDGPSEVYTPQILEILKREKVPATFFMQGENIEANLPLVMQIFNEGYEIGNHTFSHPNIANIGTEMTILELNATRRLIECITNRSTILFRPPYNADSEPRDYRDVIPLIRAKKENYITVSESIDTRDWEKNVSPDSIFERVKANINNGNIILMHDAGGNRKATIAALPRIIEYYKKLGYKFVTVAELLHQNKDALMPKLNTTDSLISATDWYIAKGIFYFIRIIFIVFILATVLSVIRLILLAILAYINKKKESNIKQTDIPFNPFVSIIVPAYNEEVNIVSSLKNLLLTDYPSFEVVFVDDGSKDQTFSRVKETFGTNEKIRIYTKPNGGKASALNFGVEHARGEIVVCIDADTQLRPDAVSKLIPHFTDPDVAAVAGNVKAGNEVNMLTKWQSIEYISSQNFDRRAFALLNCITVVPGANGAFRKTALLEVGLYTTDTLAEDCDVTIRLLRAGYEVKNETKSLAYTEVPETVSMFMRQRFRWNYGIMQCFWKHRDTLFNPTYRALGWVALPNLLIFQLILPVIAPLADLITIIGLLAGNGYMVLYYYLLFVVVEVLAAAIAFSFEGENKKRLIWIIPQRFYYRQIMYYIAIKSVVKAIKGGVMSWGTLKRTGNVSLKTN